MYGTSLENSVFQVLLLGAVLEGLGAVLWGSWSRLEPSWDRLGGRVEGGCDVLEPLRKPFGNRLGSFIYFYLILHNFRFILGRVLGPKYDQN